MKNKLMSDKIYQFIAYHLPLRLKYFVCIDVWSKTTIGDYSDTDCATLTVTEMIKRIQLESDIEPFGCHQ